MTIPVVLESDETIEFWGSCVESCMFCGSKTRYWHENTNNPVCQECAKNHKVGELPDHGKQIRKAKRAARKHS